MLGKKFYARSVRIEPALGFESWITCCCS